MVLRRPSARSHGDGRETMIAYDKNQVTNRGEALSSIAEGHRLAGATIVAGRSRWFTCSCT
jgi:hypothetical protein